MTTGLLSVIIPSRNEPYLNKTVNDILTKAMAKVEVIVVLDGYWPDEIVDDDRVRYIHYSDARGMRNGINMGIEVSDGEYIMKCDAHVMFDEGFDIILKASCNPGYVVVPRRKRLDPQKWAVIEDGRPPVDYEYIDSVDLHGIRWEEKAEERKDVEIDDIISAQGSCWFTTRKHLEKIGELDETNYGSFFLEFQELSFKTWAIGGRVIVNKKTWYAHWHKTEGRGYTLGKNEREIAKNFILKWKDGNAWDKQEIPFNEILERFLPMPGW